MTSPPAFPVSVRRSARSLALIGLVGFTAVAVPAADLPRERLRLDFSWRFHLGDAPDAGTNFDYPEVADLAKTRVEAAGLEGELANLSDTVARNPGGGVSFVQPKFDDRGWRQLDLPHDWAVELPFDSGADASHGFKPIGPGFPQNSIGWYRREFDLPPTDRGKALWLEFDGVYRNSLVWLNGHCLGRHLSGYTGFRCDISRFANFGGKNELVVRADASRFEGWFYEGAGIYRHVWLEKTSPVAIAPDGIFVFSRFHGPLPEGVCEIHLQAQLSGLPTDVSAVTVSGELFDPEGNSLGRARLAAGTNDAVELKFFLCPPGRPLAWPFREGERAVLHSPEPWSPESPKRYQLITTVETGGKTVDRVVTRFGIRTIAFDPDKGFLLNGKPYFLKGTCDHQNHAGVGTAMPDALQDFRIRKLKEMGCNAIRTSHYPPAPELLDACDRLGMLVMDENRRLDDSPWELGELRSLIRRDRNHPSVFLWSLGNEETYLQGGRTNAAAAHETAARVVTAMQTVAHELDPTRLCTVAMNHGRTAGMARVIDVLGWNYTWEDDPDRLHAAYPAKPMIGTETASTRSTRGIYANDPKRNELSAYDVNTTHYLIVDGVHSNLTAEGWWKYYAARPFLSGVFNWTGFDYRGEPTPFKWPSISSYFGALDTCGFPKDDFYYYQSVWTGRPTVHLLPHWNWPDRIGTNVNVWCYSNCREVELFLNGRSLGKKTMPAAGHLEWAVNYEPGTLSARGYNGGQPAAETRVETTGAPAAVRLAPDRAGINADGEDVSVITVSITDAGGRVVPTAGHLVHFELTGPGKIIGVGNGDPACHEPDVCTGPWQRSAFNGLAQVIVQSRKTAGEIKLTATAEGLAPVTAIIAAQPCAPRPAVP